MLHIILGILKITGIVIGLLFGFLLCTAAALFLVPVRYRVGMIKQGEKQQLNVGLSWMLRMVSVAVSGGQKGKMVVLIRLFGIKLPVFGGRRPEKGRQKTHEKKASESRERVRPDQEKKDPDAFSENRQEKKQREQLPDFSETSQSSKKTPGPPGPENMNREGSEKPRAQEQSRMFSRIRRCFAAARGIPDKAAAFWKKLKALREKPEQIKKALRRLYEKPSVFFRMIEEYEIKEIFGNLYGEAFYLLEHYKPRRIRGYLRFGAGDPALTGGLTGLIYLLLPARADQFTVMPDFYEPVFETEVIFTGYIRPVHLARTALHVFRDKKLRRAFGRLRRR